MSYKRVMRTCLVTACVFMAAFSVLLSAACTNTGTSTTANLNSNTNSVANANTTPRPDASNLEAREPERYIVTNTIAIQPTGSAPQTNVPPLQFTYARMGTDRRLSFKLPDPVGEVIYLEKPVLKYLIFPARNQYVELDSQELGFPLGDLMSPASIVARLKERAQSEQLGTEMVNGRSAVKFRLRGATDTHTKVGTAQADSIVYVDQETGLPLRSEIETTSSSGAGARVVTVAEKLQLDPEASLFEVPTGMKKVTSTELKQQVQNFVATVRAFSDYLRQQANAAQPTAGQP